MKKILLPIFLILTISLSAQTPPTPKCPSTSTLPELIAAIDSSITGPANQDRTCFRSIFTPDARLIVVGKSADGTFKSRTLTIDDWVNTVAKSGQQIFTEKQLKFESTTWANIAHLWSTYETLQGTDNKPLDRGINSIQAINDGTRWRIVEVLWQAETPDNQVPAKFLP